MSTLDGSVKDFPALIRWLADTHHDGTVSGISAKIGTSVATPNFWARGVVLPNFDHLERIATAYDLPLNGVIALWRKSRAKRRRGISGGSAGADTLEVAQNPLVSDPSPDTLPIAKSAPRRDIMSTWRELIPHGLTVRHLNHYLSMSIRRQMQIDRFPVLKAA